MTRKTAYLIDSSIYIFRSWYTLPDTIQDAEGNPLNALYGFSDFVFKLLVEVKPKFIFFAFDGSLKSSYRNEIFPEYKANRESAPDELKKQFLLCRDFVEFMGLPHLSSETYEADDIIGTLSSRLKKKGFVIRILTADKDLTQLIEKGDIWWDYSRDRKLTTHGVKKEFGVYPYQIADLLAIAGDPVDNIPGVPGIGLKTAVKLLNRFETAENILNNIEKISKMKMRGSQRVEKLIHEHKENIVLSKKLTLIETKAKLGKNLRITKKPHNIKHLDNFFSRVSFSEKRRQRFQETLKQYNV